MKTWLDVINKRLDDLRGWLLSTEENLVELIFCDGHASHITTLADLRQAAQALAERQAQAERDSENGTPGQVHQEIVQLYAIVANARRLYL